MAKKKSHKSTGGNILTNIIRRLDRAKRKGKSENYIKDLEKALAKRH